MGKLDDKVVIITGAGNGMGEATTKLFLEEGALVIAVDKMKGSLDQYRNNSKVMCIYADVTNNEDIERIVKETVSEHKGIDVLCNIAGINDLCKTIDETDEEVWDKVVDVDLKAPYMLSKKVVEVMEKKNRGVILNIGSYAACRGNHGPSYSSAKHGLVGLTMSMAVGLISKGIRTNCINPGGTKTDIETNSGGKYSEKGMGLLLDITGKFPTNGYADPIDIARAALFLCSDDSRHINGAILPVDNGMSCC